MLLVVFSRSKITEDKPGIKTSVTERAIPLEAAPLPNTSKAVSVLARGNYGGGSSAG